MLIHYRSKGKEHRLRFVRIKIYLPIKSPRDNNSQVMMINTSFPKLVAERDKEWSSAKSLVKHIRISEMSMTETRKTAGPRTEP